ncbi:heme ABC transporter permease [Aeromicrobium sp. PE09-221]|nr:heme ABC transporter permease [Aeromicrobium sp. PE09-221]
MLDLPETVPELPRAGRGRIIALFIVGGAGLVIAVLTSAAIGQMQIPVFEVIGALCRRAELICGADASRINGDAAVWEVRLPRVVLGVLVGASLAAAGAVMQGVFGNPLADPGVIGVSSGAALGASLAIVLGLGATSSFAIPAGAFVAGILTSFLVYSMARSSGRTEVVTLILTGVAVNAVAGAGLAYLTFAADTNQREQIVFWQMGSLNGALWEQVRTVAPILIIGLIAALLLATKLDLLSLGDDAARHLGIDIERLRIIAIVVVSVLTAAAVAFAGIIGFVGLVIPHLIRMLVGPGHRVLIPASAIGGALMLTVADMFARTAVPYAELPLGMLTALVGGPFFFYLIRRSRDRAGGWAA